MQIPISNKQPFVNRINKRFLNTRNVHPRPNPSNPVVKGKIINSLGSINNNKNIVNKYVKEPVRIEISEANKIGAVVNGLMRNPIPGKRPPADCSIAARAAIKAPNSNFLIGGHLVKTR